MRMYDRVVGDSAQELNGDMIGYVSALGGDMTWEGEGVNGWEKGC